MTTQQVALVQTSWEKVVPIADVAAGLFYQRLFELDPALKPMFTSDLKEQGKKLMQTITLVVRGIHELEKLLPAVQNLGRGHVGYGVQDSHYETVGTALLWTLEQGLGSGFTPDVKQAWARAYTILATAMKDAAKSVPVAA